MTEAKDQLLQACHDFVSDRVTRIEAAMKQAQQAANQETKSSAGDKYETGRAMMQLEKEKLAGQLAEALKMQKALTQIDAEKTYESIQLGSLVITPQAKYYLSISAGKIALEGTVYFAISPGSPVGRQLLGKKSGDSINLAGKTIPITEVH